MISIRILDGLGAATYASRVFRLYDTVFGDRPDEDEWRAQMYDRHRGRDDYRLAVALDGRQMLGFAWGYRGERGQYWPDLVARTLPEVGREWLGGHFEFVELAVDPTSRRQGIGRRLHDALLDGLTGRALLGTSADAADPAVRLYRSRGWDTLGRLATDHQVMGLRLPPTEGS